MGTRGTVGVMGKRWDDPAISWDDRARVAENAQNAFAEIKDVPPWSRLSLYDRAHSVAAAIGAFIPGAGYTNPWKECVAGAIRAKGFEVPGE